MTAEVQIPLQVTGVPLVQHSQGTISPTERAPPGSPLTIITVRMIMQGKEVGMIIGKKGDNVKKYREESGAKINISDASCPERIVTLTGSLDQLNKAFHLICTKFEEIREMNAQTNPSIVLSTMSFRLVIPASQCGSLIGKGGNKIKEIREISSASVQVATDMLPGSTERAVTVSGSASAISRCLQEICAVMLESPPKGATIPYRPKTAAIQAPLMYAAAVGAAAHAGYSLPNPMQQINTINMQQAGQIIAQPSTSAASQTSVVTTEQQPRQPQLSPMVSSATTAVASPYPHPSQLAQLQASQGTPFILPQPPAVGATSSQLPYGSLINPAATMGLVSGVGSLGYLNRPLNQNFMTAAAQQQTQSSEMVIPNELIGCVIGRGGAKINEIRQLSGAQIKISNCEEGNSDRKVTITGFPETISMAAYLINTSIELHKNQLLSPDGTTLSTSPVSQQPPLQPSMAGTTILPTTVSPTYTKPLSIYPYNTSGMFGLSPNVVTGLTGFATPAYDPKVLLAASKLKVLPYNSVMKQEHRFAPY
ncbi:poly(rC)-binding protein 3-like [Watersipora subatra]|uniref:poly(rC)-binding protein 3-like n=1 Tax=Watersipora subatra TaxID=2589382 RepID=UPI00355C6BF2